MWFDALASPILVASNWWQSILIAKTFLNPQIADSHHRQGGHVCKKQ